MKKLIILAIILRLLVSMFLFHPDIKIYNFQTSFLKKGIVNIYPYLINNRQSLPFKEEFVYFPLTYFVLGGYQALISPLLGRGFDVWLGDAAASSVVSNSNIFWYLFILKMPLLLIDVFIAFLLLGYFKDSKKGELAATIWLFNPFTIFLIYAYSNIDLYVVLLTLLSYLLVKQKKILLSAAFLGLAISFKLYPLLFVPFFMLNVKSIKEKLITLFVPILTFVLTVLPFWSKEFVNSALLSGLSTRIFNPGINIAMGEFIIVGLMLLSALFFFGWVNNKNFKLLDYLLIVLMCIFSFSHFHISWLLWLTPFLVIKIVQNKKLFWPITAWMLIGILIPLLYDDRYMTISLFRVYSTYYDLLPTPYEFVSKFYDPNSLQSMFHSVFAGGSIVLSSVFLKEKNK